MINREGFSELVCSHCAKPMGSIAGQVKNIMIFCRQQCVLDHEQDHGQVVETPVVNTVSGFVLDGAVSLPNVEI